jgi:hypothetical protein
MQKQNDQCVPCKVYRVNKQTYIRQLVDYICIQMLIRIDVDTHRKSHTLKFYISVYIVCILLNNRTITLY